jgi:hypothetical protein
MNKFNMKTVLLVLMMFVIVFGMGMFKTQINGDRTFHKFSLKEGTNNTYVVDVGNMGIVKYLVQPNIMTVYLRIKVPAEVKALRCEVDGIENFASQGSKKGVWKKLTTADFLVEGQWGAFVPLNIEIAVPRDDVYRREVANGNVKFFYGDKEYSTLNIKIINSTY